MIGPAGDKPGLTPGIKAWATKNGWIVLKPPIKAPTVVDPPVNAEVIQIDVKNPVLATVEPA